MANAVASNEKLYCIESPRIGLKSARAPRAAATAANARTYACTRLLELGSGEGTERTSLTSMFWAPSCGGGCESSFGDRVPQPTGNTECQNVSGVRSVVGCCATSGRKSLASERLEPPRDRQTVLG